MKRALPTLAALLLILLLLAACSGGGEQKPLPSPDQLARTLLDSSVFSDELEAADADIAAYLYGLTETPGVELNSWLSSGATAEEFTLFICADDDALKAVRDSVDARLEFQKRTFSDYAPEEAGKLDKAVVRVRENVVAVCVAADAEKAAKLLAPYFPG